MPLGPPSQHATEPAHRNGVKNLTRRLTVDSSLSFLGLISKFHSNLQMLFGVADQ